MLMSFQYIYIFPFPCTQKMSGTITDLWDYFTVTTASLFVLPLCHSVRSHFFFFSLQQIPAMNMYTSLVLLTKGETTSKNELSNSDPSLWTLQFQVL